METTREPYEFLVRWTPAGVDSQYAGTVQAQIQFAYIVRDGDVVQSWTPDPKGPFHVALNGADGIPLGDIVPGINAAALAEIASKEAERAAAITEKETAVDALAPAQARISELEAQVAALTPAPTSSVSRMQALLALHDAGLLSAVEAIIAQADERTQLAWATATDFHRTSPTIQTLWAALGKTEAELDALFAAARAISV